MIKVQVNWATVAPGGTDQAARLRRHRPGAYPGWSRYDQVLADAKARGFKVMFALAPPGARLGHAARGDREA